MTQPNANTIDYLIPDWPAPNGVVAACSLRTKGHSQVPYGANMALHVEDDPCAVLANRNMLLEQLGVSRCSWLEQLHGTDVVKAREEIQAADAVYSDQSGIACAVMTADCLPILLCDSEGSKVAALHCGWRSLAAGLVENTVSTLGKPAGQWLAWLGPAIGPTYFEVGPEVRDAFLHQPWGQESAFVPSNCGKYVANLYALAQAALGHSGVFDVYGGQWCTVRDSEHFFSFRREGKTGRMVSLIQINAA